MSPLCHSQALIPPAAAMQDSVWFGHDFGRGLLYHIDAETAKSNSSGSSINSPLGGGSCGMAGNPYAVPLYGGAPVQGYGCAPSDLPHYGDMRGASWYPASNDPRFASALASGDKWDHISNWWPRGSQLDVSISRSHAVDEFKLI
ncbi:hypothetical protein MSG28_006683 [Choristoneura fumiferana]|uniref:Uncharacterized protein n=1 Tax=Choristoneura fumiferana TaxID=7141 RepID=A0ACC0JKR7_CHOFU|nr:hypothetical protein MSG28_006683 [Choristoneura fumiferana]